MPRARPETTTTPASPRSQREAAGEAAPRGRGVAGADDRHRPAGRAGRIALGDQHRRRAPRPRRASARIRRQRRGTDGARRASPTARHLALGIGRGGERAAPCRRRARRGRAPPRAPPRREPKRGDQLAIGDRADTVRADQPQPGDPVLGPLSRQPRPIRGSVPASSRRDIRAMLPQHHQREAEEQQGEIEPAEQPPRRSARRSPRACRPTDEMRVIASTPSQTIA